LKTLLYHLGFIAVAAIFLGCFLYGHYWWCVFFAVLAVIWQPLIGEILN
jgi:hypothetical protein